MKKLSFEDKMLVESMKDSPEMNEIMKLIETSEELTESGVVAALAAKLGIVTSAKIAGLAGAISGGMSGASAGATIGGNIGAGVAGVNGAMSGAILAGTGLTITAPFALLLASLGTAWVTYLIAKKAFRVMFLMKIKNCLGAEIEKEATDSITAISKLPKGNRQHDDAVTKLDEIKSKLLEKCGKK